MKQRSLRIVLWGMIALVACLALTPQLPAFAASTTSVSSLHLTSTASLTCAQAPSPVNCDHRSPGSQGCAADAQTIETDRIYDLVTGQQVGSVSLKYSPTCHSAWAHARGSSTQVTATIERLDSVGSTDGVIGAYTARSNMLYVQGYSALAAGAVYINSQDYPRAFTNTYSFF